jgi:hypothetical protein
MVTNLKITDAANLTYPSAAAYDDNVIIACQKDNDVIVYYSTNGFSSNTEVSVETDASYPEIAIGGGGLAVITYIKDGTLYKRTSDTSGASWSAAEVVSDNQVNLNDRAANLDVYNGDIIGVWEDTRGANVDIYYDMVHDIPNDPPGAPTITGPNGGKPGTVYTFTFNAVDPDGDDVKYLIDWGDGTSDTTSFAASGTGVDASHTWADEGTYTITASTEDSNGLAGPEATKQMNVPRNKAINTPFLNFLQNHPNMFPMMQMLLQRLGLQ